MRTRIVFGLAALLAASGCTANTFVGGDGGTDNPPPVGGGSDKDAGSDADAAGQPDVAPPPNCDTSKLPTDDACVINEAEGVFVSSSKGTAVGDGSMATPIASLEAGIMAAKKSGKRVYACAETYAEAITLEDGVSVFGYFDCSNGWMVGTAHAKVQSPTSPAARATNITTATRVEAVDLVAPDFTDKSQSSIGLIADASPTLKIVHATIHAGAGGKGDDGANGTKLQDSGKAKDGASSWVDGVCTGVCPVMSFKQPAGGTNACIGEPGHDGGPGGGGGYPGTFVSSGVVWTPQDQGTTAGFPTAATSLTAQGGSLGFAGKDGDAGADGANGVPGGSVGTLAATGYVTADGTAGTSGSPGKGGGGAGGYNHLQTDYPAGSHKGQMAWAEPGAGGGAGGCPGLIGQAGRGGGASVAIIAVQSPFTLDGVSVESSAGGDGGAAGIPSTPGGGGNGGTGAYYTSTGGTGGMGGEAGVSGNGGGGPSIGLAYQGTEPTLLASTVKQAAGGSGVAQRVVNGQTIPASPAGLSKGIYSF